MRRSIHLTALGRKCKEQFGVRAVADLAIDNVGGTLLPEVFETLGNNGKVSLVGRLAGPVPRVLIRQTLFFPQIET